MSGRIRGRDAWLWWWLSFAAAVGVPADALGELALAHLVTRRS